MKITTSENGKELTGTNELGALYCIVPRWDGRCSILF